MKLTDDFKQHMEDTFYDKEVTVCELIETQAADGWPTKELEETGETFMANAKYDKFDKIKLEQGIKEDINVALTSSTAVEFGTVISVESRLFWIFRAIPLDSHYLLLGQNWDKTSLSELSV